MKNFLIALSVATLTFLASCGGNHVFPGYDEAENGTYFKLHKKGTGTETVDTGGAIFVKIKFKTAKDSVFLDINEATHAPSYPMRVDKAAFKGDFLDMFTRLHVGDSASFYVRLDSLKAHYKDQFKFEPKFDTMKYLGFVVSVDSIYPRKKVDEFRKKAEAEKAKQQEMMMKMQAVMQPLQEKARALEPSLKKKDATLLKPFLAANGFGKPDQDGIYFKETQAGTGPAVMPGMVVDVRYTGKYLDGTIFDANTLVEGQEPLSFQVGDGRMIPGFANSVAKMKQGGKATFILPPKMAYNDSLTRVFDVEVIAVRPGAPQQQGGPQMH